MGPEKLDHLGIIPDGTRRWARGNSVGYYDAYWAAMQLLEQIVDAGFDFGVRIISVYALSKENLQRSPGDLEPVYAAEERLFRDLLPSLCTKHACRANHAGSINLLPESYARSLKALCKGPTIPSSGAKELNILAAYSPWDELASALSSSPNPARLRDFMWVRDNVDLVIRTGQGSRLSNFLPLQSGYAELHFLSTLFNDLKIDEVLEILSGFPLFGRRLLGK